MKKLIVILGVNGVGKSSVSRALNERIQHSAYLDMEYCCRLNPFGYNEQTIPLVHDNLYSLLANCMRHAWVNVILFPYGLHGARAGIFDDAMARLESEFEYEFFPIVLECAAPVRKARMEADHRDDARIQRALMQTDACEGRAYLRIDTTDLSIQEVATAVMAACGL